MGKAIFFIILIVILIALSLWTSKIKRKLRAIRQNESNDLAIYAKNNNFRFYPSGELNDLYGSIFISKEKYQYHNYVGGATEIITGLYKGHQFRAFSYKRVMYGNSNNGTTKEVSNFGVIETPLDYQVFDILAVNKKMFGMPGLTSSNTKKLDLEGNFGTLIDVYVNELYVIQALEIFAPDFMQLILDNNIIFSLEMTGNRLYIYLPFSLGEPNRFQSELELMNTLTYRINEVLAKMPQPIQSNTQLPITI